MILEQLFCISFLLRFSHSAEVPCNLNNFQTPSTVGEAKFRMLNEIEKKTKR